MEYIAAAAFGQQAGASSNGTPEEVIFDMARNQDDLALAKNPLFGVNGGKHPDQDIGRLAKEVGLALKEGREVAFCVEKMS